MPTIEQHQIGACYILAFPFVFHYELQSQIMFDYRVIYSENARRLTISLLALIVVLGVRFKCMYVSVCCLIQVLALNDFKSKCAGCADVSIRIRYPTVIVCYALQ